MLTGMRPELVCKITVRTADGTQQWRGSGYPITPNRIITAAHVVLDGTGAPPEAQAGDALHITLTFGHQQGTDPDALFTTPAALVWCDPALDVAVLSCQLLPALQPAHDLLDTPPATPLAWHAQGYTEFGKAKRPGGKDAYHGELPQFAAYETCVALGCVDGPVTSEQWAGGSGSVAFDRDTSQIALAVITAYQGGNKLAQLMAVPLCCLLQAPATKDEFRRAIRFEEYARRRDYRNKVIDIVTAKLQAVGNEVRKQVAQGMNAMLPPGMRKIDLGDGCEKLARTTALAMIAHEAVTDVVAYLVSLMERLDGPEAAQVTEIIDYVLPLNYAPGVIQHLQAQLAAHQLGLIDNAVATQTLAEIIMAGYDQQPARFVPLAEGSTEVRGKTALDYSDGPEEGPGQAGVQPAVYSLLHELLGRHDTLLGLPARPVMRTQASPQQGAELERLIKDSAVRLSGALTSIRKMSGGRTVYCVLRLPPEGTPERDFRKQVLSEVRRHVQQLIFVELMPTAIDAREFEVGTYIKARVIQTHNLKKL
ncbi:MAG: hypothetical protein AB7N91_01995 [Candidatus Tectimicrobiota bacterium]